MIILNPNIYRVEIPSLSETKMKKMPEFEIGSGVHAKLVCINPVNVSEIVWDYTKDGKNARLVMVSGQVYDLNEDQAAAVTRSIEHAA